MDERAVTPAAACRERARVWAANEPRVAALLIHGSVAQGTDDRYSDIDLVVVRENLEGLYIGHEHYVQIDDDPHAVAMATGINTRAGCRRLLC